MDVFHLLPKLTFWEKVIGVRGELLPLGHLHCLLVLALSTRESDLGYYQGKVRLPYGLHLKF